MKIAYINKTRHLSNMPSTIFSTFNAYSFSQNDCETFLYLKTPLSSQNKSFQEYFNLSELDNFHIITLNDRSLILRSNEIFYRKVSRHILKENNFDFIVTRDPGYLPWLVKMKIKLNCKAFYQSHNFYADGIKRKDHNPVNLRKYQEFEKHYLPSLDGILTLNNPQKKLYEKHFKVPVFAGKPGLKQIYEPKNNFKQKMIIYTGSFQLKKGVDDLLKAFSQMQNKQAQLIMAGGRNQNEIMLISKLIKELNIEKRVHITGWLDYASLEYLLRKASAGILPLKNNFYNQYLTAPSKLFDYYAHSIPVLSSYLPSIIDFTETNNDILYFQPENISQMTVLMDKITTDKVLYKHLQERSHALARLYTWKTRSHKMLDFMQNI